MSGLSRFNPNHGAPGSGKGGQFVSGGSGGGSGAKPSAHQAHVAHEQHVAHQKYLANHPDTPGARAERKQALLEQAKADRAKAATLEKQLHSLNEQEAKAKATAAHARKAAASAKAGPKKKTLAHAAAATTRKHATLKQRISGLQGQISNLLTQAKDLEAQAAKL